MTREEHILYTEISNRCMNKESLKSIQQDYPVSKGTLARIRDGHVVQSPKLRNILGLPCFISVQPCWCGEVHQKKHLKPFADRIPDSEPKKKEILLFYETLNKFLEV